MVRWALRPRPTHRAGGGVCWWPSRRRTARSGPRRSPTSPAATCFVQPENRGTAAGVLRAAVEVQTRGITTDPVVLLPSDHYVADEAVLHGALAAAVRAVEQGVAPVVLLGMCPGEQQSGYGWILPRRRHRSPVSAASSRSRPRCACAICEGRRAHQQLYPRGAGACAAGPGRPGVPRYPGAFQRLSRKLQGGTDAQELYRRLPIMDLSRDVLQHATTFLSVLRVPPCGWTRPGHGRPAQAVPRPPAPAARATASRPHPVAA